MCAIEIANVAYGATQCICRGQLPALLLASLAREAERRASELNAQELANTAWAFAKVGQQDEQLFKAVPESELAIIGGLY